MMEAIKYFKFDMRIMRGKKQYMYMFLYPIFIYIMLHYIEIGLTCLLFWTMLYIGIPFSNENTGKLEVAYNLLPYKLSSMVLGRFLYLTIVMLITITACFGTSLYYINTNLFDLLTIGKLIVFLNFSVIIDFFSYPLYYKAQLEKNNMIKTAVIVIISLLMILFTSFMPLEMFWMTSVYANQLNFIGSFISSNIIIFIVFEILGIVLVEYISYLVSCSICRKREV